MTADGLYFGAIVWARVVDPAGGNPKERPLLIVTSTREIRERSRFIAVCITTQPQRDAADIYVVLPSGPAAGDATGLRKQRWAAATGRSR